MSYTLIPTETFIKDLKKLDNSVKLRLEKILDKIKENPKSAKPLHGKFNRFRVRFENYRLVYDVDDKEQKIFLIRVGKRGDDAIYRNL